jgi:hypothetical protein
MRKAGCTLPTAPHHATPRGVKVAHVFAPPAKESVWGLGTSPPIQSNYLGYFNYEPEKKIIKLLDGAPCKVVA